MNWEQWLDERSDSELPALLSAVVRRIMQRQPSPEERYALSDEQGAFIGYFVPKQRDEEDFDSPEFMAEMERREAFDGPMMTGEEAIALLEFRWGKPSGS